MKTSRKVGRAGAVAATLLLAGALAACGSDSTVDSDADGTSAPNVSSSRSGSSDSSSAASGSSTSAKSSSAPRSNDGGSEPRDGEVNEVDGSAGEPAARTKDDEDYLAELKDKGIDPKDSWMQDQVIAAGREECLAKEEGRDGFLVPVVAGQLEAQKMTDVSFEDAQRIITSAAESRYCG